MSKPISKWYTHRRNSIIYIVKINDKYNNEYVLNANVHQNSFVHHTMTDYFFRERETVICEHPPPHPNPLPPG